MTMTMMVMTTCRRGWEYLSRKLVVVVEKAGQAFSCPVDWALG